MPNYKSCPNCGDDTNLTSIKRCDSCQLIYCTQCTILEPKFIVSDELQCPRCESTDCSYIGEIANNDDDENDDDY